jgi:hypothetical protein
MPREVDRILRKEGLTAQKQRARSCVSTGSVDWPGSDPVTLQSPDWLVTPRLLLEGLGSTAVPNGTGSG